MYGTDAIVLKRIDVGEHDALYMFYTREYGKMRALAVGIKKPGAKLRGHLELFSLSRIRFILGRNREKLIGASLTDFWHGVRGNARKLAAAHHIIHRIDGECMEGQRDDALWELLVRSFHALDGQEESDVHADDFIRRFDHDLREAMGYGGPYAPAPSSEQSGTAAPDYGILDA